MKIAIGTDDKKTIRKGHFGESAYFAIVEVVNGEIKSKEIRENPRAGGEGPHGESAKSLPSWRIVSFLWHAVWGKIPWQK
ncbi:MAG TPA: hypothetical protein ENH70_03450 [Desulfobacteraceae bacterium]|nr:hypothetical protein [Desulfobacteraceae bacterium]